MRHVLLISMFGAFLGATAALAENHRLQDDFTFRRVGVPEPGSDVRITIQIAPRAPSAPDAAGTAPSAPSGSGSAAIAGLAPSPSGVDWSW